MKGRVDGAPFGWRVLTGAMKGGVQRGCRCHGAGAQAETNVRREERCEERCRERAVWRGGGVKTYVAGPSSGGSVKTTE
jgi:hypothetical protein